MTVERKERKLTYKRCNFQLIEIEERTKTSSVPETKNLMTREQSEQFMNRLQTALDNQKDEFRYWPPLEDEDGKPLLYGRLLRGFASTWDRDTIDDEMHRDCFNESIEYLFKQHTERFGAPYIKSLRNHEDLASILHYIKATDEGLYVEFWCLNTAIGRDYYVEVMTGAINQMSIGFIPLATTDYTDKTGETEVEVRVITLVELLEVSGVLWPCNYATSLGKSTEPEQLKTAEVPDTVDALPEPNEEVGSLDIKTMCERLCADLGPVLKASSTHTADEHKAVLEAAVMFNQLALKTMPGTVEEAKEKTSTENSETGTSDSSVADEKAAEVLAELKASNNSAMDLLKRLERKD